MLANVRSLVHFAVRHRGDERIFSSHHALGHPSTHALDHGDCFAKLGAPWLAGNLAPGVLVLARPQGSVRKSVELVQQFLVPLWLTHLGLRAAHRDSLDPRAIRSA